MPIVLNRKEILPGQRMTIGFPAGRLPTGRQVTVKVEVIRSLQDGPAVLLLGGMHGDEVNGVEIVRRALASPWMDHLRAGMVIAIPLLNVYGFINARRETPDGKDINRCFPGSSRGSMAARLAAILSRKILPLIDWGIDFHTGAARIYNHPQLRYSPADPLALQLAQNFAPPFLVPKLPISKSLRKAFLRHQKTILIYEGGENLRLDPFCIEKALEGLKRLFTRQGMLESSPAMTEKTIRLVRTSWQRSPTSGLFQWFKSSGQGVVEGEPLGVIRIPYGTGETVIKARGGGYIIGHSNATLVSQGDALFHLGQTD
jgi:hypothetical protein